jgi:hypothetical protein
VTIAPHEDAYGAILLAALEGRDAAEIMERDDGTVWCGDGSDYLHPPRRWPATERRMLRFARGRVLESRPGRTLRRLLVTAIKDAELTIWTFHPGLRELIAGRMEGQAIFDALRGPKNG